MKKILTFLVMLCASVSILSAQNAKFNYQAVVRDVNNDHNLMMNTPVEVVITIQQLDADGSVIEAKYDTTITGQTNRNGMFSCILGPSAIFDSIDWRFARIDATFNVDGTEVSTVETPVMAVPYALQAKSAPLEITTKAICDYLNDANTDGLDVDSIYKALVANVNFKKAAKDSIINYIKTQDSIVKELTLYFLAKVDTDDVDTANAHLSQDVKDQIKQMVKQYIIDNKDLAYEVLIAYINQTTLDDVKDVWHAVRNNQYFDTIFHMAQDSAIQYIKDHRELVEKLVRYYIDSVITVDDVTNFHEYFKQAQNGVIYDTMLKIFNNYLNHYMYDVYYAVSNKNCDTVTVCGLQAQIDQLKLVAEAIANECPRILSGSISSSDNPGEYVITATLDNASANAMLTLKDATGADVLPIGNFNWQKENDTYTISGFDGIQSNSTYKFVLSDSKDGCPNVNSEFDVTSPQN